MTRSNDRLSKIRERLNNLAREAFLLESDISKAEQEFVRRYKMLKLKAANLYRDLDAKLDKG